MDSPGQHVGRYELLRRIGAGGMGEVYAARDPVLKRNVALKRLPPELAEDPQRRSRLLNEARAAGRITSDCVASLHDVVEADGQIFLVMELVEGDPLHEVDAPLPEERFLEIALQCATALAAAHAEGIVHGDIKPDNILVTPGGQVKVLDFGVSRMMSTSSSATGTRSPTAVEAEERLGYTPAYVAPELLRGRASDARSDMFSLGIVFYQLLAGRHPFPSDTTAEVTAAILADDPEPLDRVRPDLAPDLVRVVSRMLAKDPRQRYATAHELIAALRAVAESEPSDEAHETDAAGAAADRWRLGTLEIGRRRAGAGLTALAAVALLLGTSLWWQPWAGPETPAASVPGATFNASEWIIAVLPSGGFSVNDRDLTVINDGLAATLTARLTRLSRVHSLQVIPASAVRGITTLDQARRELGVTAALTFDTWDMGDGLRINANLVDVTHGRQIAAETIDGNEDDLLGLQERVSAEVLRMLRIELAPRENALLDPGTVEPRAYNAYVRGRGQLEYAVTLDDVLAAIDLFEMAIELDPEFAAAHAALGQAFWRRYEESREQDWIDRASEECETATELDPEDARSHLCRGEVLLGTGRYEEATAAFDRANELDPTLDEAFRELATARLQLGQVDRAEQAYQLAIRLRPHYWRGYNSLGAFYYSIGRYADAVAAFKKVTELAPESYVGFSNLGASYFQIERWDDARLNFERARDIEPADVMALSNLGTLEFYEGDFETARERFRQALEVDDRTYLWRNLADTVYWGIGDREAGRKLYRDAARRLREDLAVNPNDAGALCDLALAEAVVGRPEEARRHLSRALELQAKDPGILLAAAKAEQVLGNRERAMQLLAASLEAGTPTLKVRREPIFAPLQADGTLDRLLEPDSERARDG